MSKKSYRKYAATTMAVAVAASAVAPVVAGAEESDFSDVSEKSPHYEAIKAMAEAGIIQGDLVTGKFNPYDNVYRVQVAKMLQRALDLEVPANADEIIKDYTDITANYTKEDRDAIAAVTAAKIFQGDTKTGKFNAWTPINREQMASVIVRAYQLHNVDADHVDVNLSNVDTSHKASVQILANLGLTTELSDYRPADPTNREQFASFLHRTIEKVGAPDTPVYELEVKSVSAINKTGVTVNIKELAEDLKDVNVVVRNSAGQVVPTIAKDVSAGTTETTFHFVDPLTYNPGGDWTVNGVAYDAGDFAVAGVEALTNSGKYIEVIFNQPIESLHQSELSVRDSTTLSRVGIEDVKLSSDGMSAQITLLGDEREQDYILRPNREYTLSITKDGNVSSFKFEIPAVVEESNIVSYNLKNRTIDIRSKDGIETLEFPENTSVDFEQLLGREATVWFNSDKEVTRHVLTEQNVKYDAVEWDADDKELKLVTEDEKYELSKEYEIRANGQSTSASALANYDYAKVVFDNRNEVKFIVAYDWNPNHIVVKETEETVVLGYESQDEINLKDYVIVKDGSTISIDDIEQGDILFYNNTASNAKGETGYAEVFNATVTGEIQNVFRDEIEVNGELYEYMDEDTKLVEYLDEDEIDHADSDVMKAFQEGGDVTLYLNRQGDLIFITGDQAEVQKSTLASHLIEDAIYYNNNHEDRGVIELEYVNEKGQEVLDVIDLRKVKKITNSDGVTFEVDKAFSSTNSNKIDHFKLDGHPNPGGVIQAKVKNDTDQNISVDLTNVAVDNSFIKVTKDNDGNVVELDFEVSDTNDVTFESSRIAGSNDPIKLDAKFIEGARLQSNTVVFDASAGFDIDKFDKLVEDGDSAAVAAPKSFNPKASEIKTTTWGELANKGYEIHLADVYADKSGYVEYLVIKHTNAEDTTDQNALVTQINRNTDGEITRLKAFVNGVEKTFNVDKVDDNDAIKVGSTVRLTTTDADPSFVTEVEIGDAYSHTAKVSKISRNDNILTLEGLATEFNIKDAKFYNAKDTKDIKTALRSDVKEGDTVTVVIENTDAPTFANMVVITNPVDEGGTTPELDPIDLTTDPVGETDANVGKLKVTFTAAESLENLAEFDVTGDTATEADSDADIDGSSVVITLNSAPDTPVDLSAGSDDVITFDVVLKADGKKDTPVTITVEWDSDEGEWVVNAQPKS